MTRVMISYRNVPQEKAFAIKLRDEFQSAGVETWLDIDQLKRGYSWKDGIIDGIKNSDYVVICMSMAYFDSEICKMECYIARGYGKKIIPLWIDSDMTIDPIKVVPDYIETEGIEYQMIGVINGQSFWGLPLKEPERIKRIINAVVNPIEPITYDIYISYRYGESVFATKVADELNRRNLSTFIMTQQDIGSDVHTRAWNALLQAKFHLVILTPDIMSSNYIKNEIRVSQTKNTIFIPVLAENFVNNKPSRQHMLSTFTTDEFKPLISTQWFETDKGFAAMIDEIQEFIENHI